MSEEEIQIERNKQIKYNETFWKCECKKCHKIFHTCSQNIKKIKSCGCSKKNRVDNKKYICGYVGKTLNGLQYKVIDYSDGLITVEFLKTGYITKVNSTQLSNKRIKDRLSPSVCGVGYLGYYNDSCDKLRRNQKYTLWKGIIERCYNPKRQDYKNYGEKGVTVCERWKCFANFLEDIKNIEGYDEEKFLLNQLDLDKDIKQKNIPVDKKVYSLNTCMFVDKHINRSITTRKQSPNINIISTKDNFILKTSCPVEELAKRIGVKTQYITRILRGEAKTHKGWRFKYF